MKKLRKDNGGYALIYVLIVVLVPLTFFFCKKSR